MLQFDDEQSRKIESTYRTPDIVAQRRVVLDALDLRPGERALDIGSGPGLLAHDMARVLGADGRVDGVDVSESMLAIARRRDAAPGAAPVELHEALAAELPFADATFDVAVSTQVYEYVEDMPAALDEVRRVLRPGGRLVVLDTDWGSVVWHSNDPARMHRMLAAWDEHLADPYLPRRLRRLLADAGFEGRSCSTTTVLNAGYEPDTYSANLIEFIRSFVVGRPGVDEAEVAAWADDLRALGDDYFFSLNRYLFAAATATSARASGGSGSRSSQTRPIV